MSKELNELIQELGKIVDGNQSIVDELDKLKSLYEQLKVATAEEFEYLFEIGEQCWFISSSGSLFRDTWDTALISFDRYHQGNVFKTKEEAERERDKRALLVRFRQFRDKCNGDWKPFEHGNQFYISFDTMTNVIHTNCVYINKSFALFGYFKNKPDCERAIDLFGDEIKRLWVDE
ncbi:hypothetical protein ACWOA2_07730 [Granulicatella elegans]